MRRVLVAACLWLAVAGCAEGDSFQVMVVFPDQLALEQAQSLDVYAIEPAEASSCQQLLDEDAVPGDSGYRIEGQVAFDLDGSGAGDPLDDIGPGRRLFFARARNPAGVVILTGCSEATAGGGGTQMVTIELGWVVEGCATDADCSNDDLWCNGTWACREGLCVLEMPDCEDGDVCTQDICNEDTDSCDHPQVTEPPDTEGPPGQDSCNDGVDNDCDGLTDQDDPGCTACSDNADCDDENSCTRDRCEASVCVNEPLVDGMGCDDGLYCTDGDMCTGGQCAGQPRDCSSLADPCNDVHCDEDLDQCVRLPFEDGTLCNDARWCTVDDVCSQGVCTGADRDCSQEVDTCKAGVCDEALDACVGQPLADGTRCDDGAYCTENERCQEGLCVGGEPRDCSGADSVCAAGVCDEDQDACVAEPLGQGTACDDGLFCSVDDACDGLGSCTGSLRDCSMLDNQCNQGVCNESERQCEAQPANEDTACDDGLYCTEGETCQQGQCDGGAQRDCDDDDPCTSDSCNESDDLCDHQLTPNPGAEGPYGNPTCGDSLDNDCDRNVDGDDPDCQQCNGDQDCDDGNPCTVNTCNAGSCETAFEPDDTPCDDGLFCTDPDACLAGVCTGAARDCSGMDSDCTVGVCNETQDACTPQAINEGQACEDGLFCTVNETCLDGACQGGEARDCSQLDDQCNQGVCDEGAGACQAQPAQEAEPCNDGLYCNVGETCQAGSCIGGNARDCSSFEDQCNVGVCNEDADACEAQVAHEGEACDDGVYCLDGETCQAGVCTGATPRDCSHLDGPCSVGGCNEALEQCETQTANEGNPCDDGLACTTGETCQAGSCSGGDPLDCSHLEDACNQGVCDEGQGGCVQQPLPAGTDCGTCLACDASGVCAADLGQDEECPLCQECAPGGTCTDQAAGSDVKGECADDLFCNGVESCDGDGACQGGLDPCGGLACDEETDSCAGCVTNDDCSPGDVCFAMCSTDGTGCVTPPASMSLSCTGQVTPPAVSDCTLTLDGGDNTGQADCLQCTAAVAPSVWSFDFEDAAGACSLDGWTLVAGAPATNCTSTVNGCGGGSLSAACCDQFNTICNDASFATPVLETHFGTNCGGDVGQWRLEKVFDFTGLTDLSLSFDAAQHGTDFNDGMLVYALTPGEGSVQVFCRNGDDFEMGDDVFRTYHAALPDWADDNPDVTLRFVMHSNNNNDHIYLDNVRVAGFGGGCPGTPVTAWYENFDDPASCDTTGWDVQGMDACRTDTCTQTEWNPSLETTSGSLTAATTVDASGLDEDVVLSFWYGGQASSATVSVAFDTGGGYQTAWSDDFSGLAGCRQDSVNLSGFDPAVHNHPALGLQFQLQAPAGESIVLAGASLEGIQYCAATANVMEVSALVEAGSGQYDFTVSDTYGSQLTGHITCIWEPDPGQQASDDIRFLP